jgi:hypothetical protein
MAATLLGDEQAGDLTLHSRGDHNRPRFGQGLGSRCYISHLAEYLARRVNREPCPDRPFGIVLLGDRVAEQRKTSP